MAFRTPIPVPGSDGAPAAPAPADRLRVKKRRPASQISFWRAEPTEFAPPTLTPVGDKQLKDLLEFSRAHLAEIKATVSRALNPS